MKNQPPKSRILSRPRDYAAAIVDAAGDVARQREIFQSCPVEWRALARELAKGALEKAEQLSQHRKLIRSAAERDHTPLKPIKSVIDHPKSSPDFGRQRLAELRAALGQKEPA